MPQYLINIAVGPVQGFIASARKLRDLWYGSFLLSEASKAVAESLTAQQCELIFPGVHPEQASEQLQENSALNVANTLLALSPSQGNEPKTIVEEAEQAFCHYWKTIAGQALDKADNIYKGAVDKEMFKQQVEDFGEFYAAWVEFDPKDYQKARKWCGKKLAGRKRLRDFAAPTWEGMGRNKSSLDGIFESVFHQKHTGSFSVKKGEELDAIGIVKRFGPLAGSYEKQFDSLPQVASQSYLQGLKEAARQSPTIAEILGFLPKAQTLYPAEYDRPRKTKTTWDGWPEDLSSEILFPSVVQAEIRQREDDEGQKAVWEQLEGNLKLLWQATREPLPYCCLLVGDGDNMRDTLKKVKVIDTHKDFSSALAEFAGNTHSLVEEFDGRVVYAGGDDVMAYVPLHTALECAGAVRKAFDKALQGVCEQTEIVPPTFSMGMVIFHMHKPLHQALELAREAEQISKQQDGKNTLTIIQSKRSGTDITVTGPWPQENKGPLQPLVEQLEDFTQAYGQGGWLSSRLGYQLRAISKECGSHMAWKDKQPNNVCAAEALRMVLRKQQQQSGKKIEQDEAAALLAGHTDLRELSDRLIISHLISRARNLAEAEYLADKEERNV